MIWNKEQLHGKYSGCHTCAVFTVLFDNDAKLSLQREDVFAKGAVLPKRVHCKLVENLSDELT